MDLWTSFVDLLKLAVSSHAATVVAAAALAFVVWAVQKVPFVETWVAANPKLETVVTLFLAVAPAVVTALATGSWADALMVAVSTFLMVLGGKAAVAKLTA
ncbi:MAG TPA: hypothetical protein VM577_11530 [Anaerovoracaceae bacterium]|nr:hypothetical protein [Anaerovoracaceae bacterium]